MEKEQNTYLKIEAGDVLVIFGEFIQNTKKLFKRHCEEAVSRLGNPLCIKSVHVKSNGLPHRLAAVRKDALENFE